MKKLYFFFFVFSLTLHLSAQVRLDVEGDAKILGKMEIIKSVGDSSIFIGANAGLIDDGNNKNTFVGTNAGRFNIVGFRNAFFGQNAGFSNTDGIFNAFFGQDAGRSNDTGFSNAFFGQDAGSSNGTGHSNAFFGQAAGRSNGTGHFNAFFGQAAGFSNGTGFRNSFFGQSAGSDKNNTRSTILGYNAQTTVDLDRAIAIGHNAVVACDNCAVIGGTGADAVKVGIGKTNPQVSLDVVGDTKILGKMDIKSSSTDGDTLLSFSEFTDPSFFFTSNFSGTGGGGNSLELRSFWKDNAMVWRGDGRLGLGVAAPLTDLHIKQSSSNEGIRLERSSGTNNWTTNIDGGNDYAFNYNGVLRAYIQDGSGDFAITSDGRLKKNISPLGSVLQKVMKLKPANYYYKNARNPTQKSWGFIAQEVEAVFPEIVREKNGYKALVYDDFAIISIKAIQELATTVAVQKEENIEQQAQINENGKLKEVVEQQQAQIATLQEKAIAAALQEMVTTQQAQITTQEQQITELTSLVEKLLTNSAETQKSTSYVLPLEQKALLAQNQPNPFRENTLVDYFVPATIKNAHIQVTNSTGQLLGQVKITEMGKGQVTIQSKSYPAGTYFYSLVLDGQVMETKRMMLAR